MVPCRVGKAPPVIPMSREVFGDPSRFAIEIRHDLANSSHLFVHGRFLYWIDGRPIGEDGYGNLTDSFSNMGWVRRWWWMIMTDAPREELGGIGLPEDVVRFNLMFDFGVSPEPILLIACADTARLIWFPDGAERAVVIENAIEVFERPIRDSYSFIDALHDKVGFGGGRT